MAVPEGPTEKRYAANGVTTVYTIPFLLLGATDLKVYLNDIELTSGFTISGVGSPQSTITFLAAPSGILLLQLNVPFQRLNDYQENGDFLSSTVNRDFDRIWQALKQLLRYSTRALSLGAFDIDGNGFYRAKGNGIINLASANGVDDAAVNWKDVKDQIALVLETGQGPVNNAVNVVYVAPDNSITNVQALSSPQGSSLVKFIAAGANTLSRTVQDKLRDLISRADYTTDAAFNSAKVGKVSIDGSGNLSANVMPTGSAVSVSLSDMARDTYGPGALQALFGPRPVVRYRNASSVRIHSFNAAMGEFRFMGQYTKGKGRVLPLPAQTASVVGSGLGSESVFRTQNWYAAFAVAATSDPNAVIKTMPFLRVASVSGLTVSLNKAGEGVHSVQAQTYAWTAANNLASCKCLVVSEGGAFSGRVATITANAAGTVDLNDVGTLGFGDFLLPAPPGYAEFGYLGSFYMDTAEVRNIYDTGGIVRSRGIFILSPATNGQISAPLKIDCSGYIGPLSTGVILDSSANISTASTGQVAEYFAGDSSNHTTTTQTLVKTTTDSLPYYFSNNLVGFLYPGTMYYSNAGAAGVVGNRVSAQLNMNGYIEP